jgi:hypothetical protein
MSSEPTVNRYRIEVRHPDEDGTDVEVIAADEDAALAAAAAAAPEGSTLHRVVPLEIGYVAPEVTPPPGTDATGVGLAARSGRASGVPSEPAIHDEDDDKHKGRRRRE